MARINRASFFADVKTIFNGGYNGAAGKGRIQGLDVLIDEWEKRPDVSSDDFAYILATTAHETAYTMQPIAEYGKGKGKKYGVKGKYGQVPYGRGYVQLTWDYNYEKADKELGLNGALLKDFDLALDPKIAVQILFEGMKKGWFTGKKLNDYIDGETEDEKEDLREFSNSRKIINGTDKQVAIGQLAMKFKKALDKYEIVNPYPISTSRTAQGAAGSALGGTAILLDATNTIVSNVEAQREAFSSGSIAQIVIGLIVVGGSLVALYARWDDAGRPKFWKRGF